jgi:2-hydroxy-3-keto-5-methylthiopentenyl-1-phosphate phosphatase
VCGERCKRGAVAGLAAFAYAGDGVSDRCVSLAAERRFARDGLARWLDEQGVAYEPFEDLFDIVRAVEALD